MPPEFIEAILAGERERAAEIIGYPLPDEVPDDGGRRLVRRLRQMTADPSVQPWLTRFMVRREAGDIVGECGFHAAPDQQGRAELGYRVLPAHRRQGYASEAAAALMTWARREHGVRQFLASVSPTNEASLGVVGKLGFKRVGVQWDELDGEELVFELRAR